MGFIQLEPAKYLNVMKPKVVCFYKTVLFTSYKRPDPKSLFNQSFKCKIDHNSNSGQRITGH